MLNVSSTTVSGCFVPGGQVVASLALLLDGTPQGMAAVEQADAGFCRFSFALPGHVLGNRLDVVAVETGRSVLDQPFDLAAARGLRWTGWALRGGTVDGQFALDGPAAPVDGGPILVELRTGPDLYGRCFAAPAAAGAIYHFTFRIPSLPAMQQPAAITPVVGGIAVDQVLAIDVQGCGHAGYAEPSEAPRAKGWAVDLDTGKRVKLELRIDGKPVATGFTGEARPDVAELGLGDGRAGFTLPFPRTVRLDQPHVIEVVVAATGIALCNSPYLRPASPRFVGHFDGVDGAYAGGWAIEMRHPGRPVMIEAVCGGAVIGSGPAELHRGDVTEAGMPTAACGFRFLLNRPVAALLGRDIHVRVAGTNHMLAGSPRQASQNANIARFLSRAATMRPAALQRLSRQMTHRTRGLVVSIIMPVFDTPRDWLIEALASVRAQWSAHWELICIDDGSALPHVRPVLDAFAQNDPRIRVLRAPGNLGIARAVNFGLRAARGSYVTFLDHDDVLEPDAVYRLAEAALRTGAELIYSDEVLTTDDSANVIEVRARPAFSHDYFLSHPYFVHMVCVRTDVARQLAGWDESLAISADVDFVLRAIEAAGRIAHVPHVLYRWRTHPGSTGHAKQGQVSEATSAALARHLARLGSSATVSPGLGFNQYRVDWPDDGGEVLVVIPTKNRVDLLKTCIESIERTADANMRIVVIDHDSTDPKTLRYLAGLAGRHTVMPFQGAFNYARMNNQAVKLHGGAAKYLLFMNNDVEAQAPGWIGRLRSLAGRKEVGAAGPLLLFGNGRVQHAGVLVGFNGAADHAMKNLPAYVGKDERLTGYNCNLTVVRDYAAVTAACMMVRREVFTRVRGFDEKYAVGFNDTDLCLRIGQAGYRILYDGFTTLFHHESATRIQSNDVHHPEDDARLRKQWRRFFTEGDPFYNPMLAPSGTDHTLRHDPGCKGRQAARVVVRRPAGGQRRGRLG